MHELLGVIEVIKSPCRCGGSYELNFLNELNFPSKLAPLIPITNRFKGETTCHAFQLLV